MNLIIYAILIRTIMITRPCLRHIRMIFKYTANGRKEDIMYQTRMEDCQKQSSDLLSLCKRISFWRLIFAAAAVILFCFGYSNHFSGYYAAGALAALCFFLLVRYHLRLKAKLSDLANYESVIRDSLARLDDGWKQFSIDGSRYLNDKTIPASDLDILGNQSLYQYLCTAGTVFGQDQLAHLLTRPDLDIQKIRSRQQAVKELAQKTEFTLRYQAAARALRQTAYDVSQKNLDAFFQALTQNVSSSPLKRTVIYLFPVLTLTFLGCCLCGIYKEQTLVCFLTAAMIQLSAALLGNWKNNRLLAPVYKMNQTITPYRRLIELLTQETFDSPYLQQLQQTLFQTRENEAPNHPANLSARISAADRQTGRTAVLALQAFQELEAIAGNVVLRHNVYASLLLNSLFCYDFHCVERYRKWKETYRNSLKLWLDTVGTIEALISLGVIAYTRQTYTLPQITDGCQPVLNAACLKHPLIKEPEAIGNDFHLTHQTCILTGSNMSGKTTFMRSIGVNLALAYAGGFCTASALSVSLMEICTSMRTADDVSQGISSFYAELLRIKKIMEVSRRQLPMIALIDEIYKGTNSKDRILAARETIKNLAKPHVLTILTTHDLQLCELEQESAIDAVNYYFTETYHQNEIVFDYQIRPGICTTSNAQYLLHMAGIL